uniref:Peptidase M12A domain-containing protein n=1 Tax=Arion vulgaris TaxID=1028688 RepID=A0A0B7BV28_9EUPU
MYRQRLLTLWYVTFLTVTGGYAFISVKERGSSDQEKGQDAHQQLLGQEELLQDDGYLDSRFRRESTGGNFQTSSYVETVLSSPGNELGISLMELPHASRHKRGAKHYHRHWPRDIPFVIDPSYTAKGAKYTEILKRALQRIMENLCVVYHDVTNKFDQNNKNWFMENGFTNNAYLLFKDGPGCSATTGYNPDGGPSNVYPCRLYTINQHEVLHTLGGLHTQQIARRNNYISINPDNIQDTFQFTYRILNEPEYVDDGFDTESSLLYTAQTWTRNGLETYSTIRDDIFDLDNKYSPESTVFYEMVKVFKCNELYCKNSQTDCGEGYHTLYMGVCQCVCPPEFDPLSNCKTLFNSPNFKLNGQIPQWL